MVNEKRPPDLVDRELVVEAMLRASRMLVAVASRSLADVGEDVTLTQYRSMVVLASKGPQSVAKLAQEVGVTPATASRLCDRLVRKGLIARREDPLDRRAVQLALAAGGRRIVDAVTESRRREITQLLDSVPAEAQRSLVAALQLLSDAAGETPEQDWSAGWDL